MKALIFIQADSGGLTNLSTGEVVSTASNKIVLADGSHYFDLAKAFVWSAAASLEFNVDSDFTIEGWVIPSSGDFQTLFTSLAQSSFTDGILLDLSSSVIRLSTGSSAGVDDNNYNISVDATKPFHFAWVLNGVSKTLYVNGLVVGSSIINKSIGKSPSAITFGGAINSVTNNPYASSKAKVSQFVIWDSAKYFGSFTPARIDYEAPELTVFGSQKSELLSLVLASDTGVIAGNVLVKGVRASRKVCLYLRSTNELVDTTWSDNSGNYRFDNLGYGAEYYVLALDHTRNYNAVTQDMLRAQ